MVHNKRYLSTGCVNSSWLLRRIRSRAIHKSCSLFWNAYCIQCNLSTAKCSRPESLGRMAKCRKIYPSSAAALCCPFRKVSTIHQIRHWPTYCQVRRWNFASSRCSPRSDLHAWNHHHHHQEIISFGRAHTFRYQIVYLADRMMLSNLLLEAAFVWQMITAGNLLGRSFANGSYVIISGLW